MNRKDWENIYDAVEEQVDVSLDEIDSEPEVFEKWNTLLTKIGNTLKAINELSKF